MATKEYHREYYKKWYLKNLDKTKDYHRAYYKKNSKEITAKKKEYEKRLPKEIRAGYNKKYMSKPGAKEKKVLWGRIYNQRPDIKKRNAKHTREWGRNNPDKVRENRRKQLLRPGFYERLLFLNLKRRALKMSAKGIHTFKEWEDLKKLYLYTCLCCGKKEPDIKLTEDHIVPLSCGGTNDIGNIQPLCRSCNCKKHTESTDYRNNYL